MLNAVLICLLLLLHTPVKKKKCWYSYICWRGYFCTLHISNEYSWANCTRWLDRGDHHGLTWLRPGLWAGAGSTLPLSPCQQSLLEGSCAVGFVVSTFQQRAATKGWVCGIARPAGPAQSVAVCFLQETTGEFIALSLHIKLAPVHCKEDTTSWFGFGNSCHNSLTDLHWQNQLARFWKFLLLFSDWLSLTKSVG